FRNRAMCHRSRVAAERLNATKTFGELEDAQMAHEDIHIRACPLEREGDHPAEAAHLLFRQRVIGMVRQTRIVDLAHEWVAVQMLSDGLCVFAVLAHAYGERLDAAQDQPAIEW